MKRRAFLERSLAFLALLSSPRAWAVRGSASVLPGSTPSNFRRIYLDPKLRDQFFLFLQNVFHLYPEDRFHQLIIDLTTQYETDREIYENLQAMLPGIKPMLGDITYALPALRKQKSEMARQAMEFLTGVASVDGYVEIGSTGRYVSELQHRVTIGGPIYLVNDVAPSYSPLDILERGQIAQIGSFVPMGNYDPFARTRIPEGSVDLVTNFIGFHHCPSDRLAGFVHSIHGVLRPGGRLLLRDHDVDSADMDTMVALAHDVFNAGVWLPWEANHAQVRRFRSIAEWSDHLGKAGFHGSGRALAQAHDPTRNLLLEFVKV